MPDTFVFHNTVGSAADLLRSGGLVAVPTETVYGLAAIATDASAVEKIYEVKGRPEGKPLSIMVSGPEAISEFCTSVPPSAYALAERFWPGPLTIILPSKDTIPDIVRAGGSTVGLRCPDSPLTLQLLRNLGVPLAAPSANPSGASEACDAQRVLDYFDGKIAGVIDGGTCDGGTPSTIFDMSATPFRVLRKGPVTEAAVRETLRDSVRLIGITGGSGCGKTTALRALQKLGALIIDCDAVYHDLTRTSMEMRDALCMRFGNVYHSGSLDRRMLGNIVFNDEEALRDLNEITHRFVDERIDALLTEFAMNGGTVAGIDAIALLENDFSKKTVCNIAVLAPLEQRVSRLMKRDGLDRALVMQRINAQKPDEYFKTRCDYVLYNDGLEAEFENHCLKLFSEVLYHG